MKEFDKSSVPNVFLLGEAKCGTTSLAMQLAGHHNVFVPKEKECHFFDNDEAYKKNVRYYREQYYRPVTSEHTIRIDATPSYLRSKKVPRRICDVYGNHSADLKFIIMIRDPVKRAWSHYLHRRRVGAESLPFEEAIVQEDLRLHKEPETWVGYYRDGLYAQNIAHWFQYFDVSQFIIVTLDELDESPQSTLSSIYSFLGLEINTDITELFSENMAGTHRSVALAELLASQSIFKVIYRKMVPLKLRRLLSTRLHSLNTRGFLPGEKPKINIETRFDLKRKYSKSILELENLLGRDFSQWK